MNESGLDLHTSFIKNTIIITGPLENSLKIVRIPRIAASYLTMPLFHFLSRRFDTTLDSFESTTQSFKLRAVSQ